MSRLPFALALAAAALLSFPGSASAHEISVRGGPLCVRGAEAEEWFGNTRLPALSVQGGYSVARNLTITFGWTFAQVGQRVEWAADAGDAYASEYDDSYYYGSESLTASLGVHRIAVGAKLQRPLTRVLWPFVEVQGLVDVVVVGFDAGLHEGDDANVLRRVGGAPGVFLGGGVELMGGPKPTDELRHDVRRPAFGYIARLGYVLVAPYYWSGLGDIPAGGLEFTHGLALHF